MKLNKKLSGTQFIISNFLILIIGLIFLGGIYYILNIQYHHSNDPFSIGPVTTAPKTLTLDLDHPDDESLSFDSSIIISGKTSPQKEVLIYTDTQDTVINSKKDGTFSYTLDLDEGVNKITVAVFDNNGDSKSDSRTVYYSKDKI